MKKDLSAEEVKLKQAQDKTEQLLRELEVEQKEAEKVEAAVNKKAIECDKNAKEISIVKEEAAKELEAALPAQ